MIILLFLLGLAILMPRVLAGVVIGAIYIVMAVAVALPILVGLAIAIVLFIAFTHGISP